jgi:uncharacterized protein (DUF1330 family)
LLAKYGAKVLAMETNPRAIEGKAKTMNVIIQFPSEEVVDTFYNDPEYQKIIDLRLKSSSNCTIILLNEFERK